MFLKYPKIKRLGHEDTDGILTGDVMVEEKIDGANTSVWIENGTLKCASRTRELTGGFNGFVDYVNKHDGIKSYLNEFPNHRLYGEWLVKHTIPYSEESYKQFYLFDIFVMPQELVKVNVLPEMTQEEIEEAKMVETIRAGKWMPRSWIMEQAAKHDIKTPEVFAELQDPLPDAINEYVGKTTLGEKGEGVVVKNEKFINKWGARVCAKVVTQEFKEDNAIVFGGNNKHSETYSEMKMVNEFMTAPRIKKVMQKLQPTIDKRLDKEHTSRIIQTAYHDMFEEELWSFVKKHKKMDFDNLQRLACRKAAKIYHDLLDGHESVAYKE
jgi:hypothetical protein